ncbi:MAG: CoA-binding protein [archaeon]
MNLKGKSFAVVGASNNAEKYGYRVVGALIKISNKVFPINPKETQILGHKVFKKFAEIKEKVDIVVFVVPPAVSLSVLREIKEKKLHFWFQPGSFDDDLLAFCKKNALIFTSDKCVIIESEKE